MRGMGGVAGLGGLMKQAQQMQERMKKAQEEPDEYRDLIVRVAGYSAYFAELNRNTQNEIIARTEYEELC